MQPNATIPQACAYCGTLFVPFSASAGLYCSRPCAGKGRTRPLDQRFWAKVDKNGPIPAHRPELGPCWLWTGSRAPSGHGHMGGSRSKERWLAHRLSFTLANGPIPDRLMVRHACDNPPCVRPEHLELGTQTDNMQDCSRRGRVVVHRKLTWPAVRAMRIEYAAGGVSQEALATRYGVTRSTVEKIVHGERWVERPA